MKIAIGADHRGWALKESFLKDAHWHNRYAVQWTDTGAFSNEPSDYPLYAVAVVDRLLSGVADKGILICGTGVGMSIAANRFNGIYAGIAWSVEVARMNASHDAVNVLILPADYLNPEQARDIVDVWLSTPFLGGSHAARLEMIDPPLQHPSSCC